MKKSCVVSILLVLSMLLTIVSGCGTEVSVESADSAEASSVTEVSPSEAPPSEVSSTESVDEVSVQEPEGIPDTSVAEPEEELEEAVE